MPERTADEAAELARSLQEDLREAILGDKPELLLNPLFEAHPTGEVFIWRPDSTNIDRIEWVADPEISGILTVKFRSGGIYQYAPVGARTFVAIAGADSAGKAFDFHIRKARPPTPFVRLDLQADLPRLDLQAAPQCDHANVGPFGPPMVRCPDCGKVVARPALEPTIPFGHEPRVITDDDEP